MGTRAVKLSLGLVVLLAAILFAHEARQNVRDLTEFEANPTNLPAGNSVWSVRMVRSGGFTGLTQVATLTSDGEVACVECARTFSRTLSKEDLLAVVSPSDLKAALVGNSTVKAIKPGEKVKIAPPVLCRDCFVTRMTVQHRDSNGKVETFFVSWDDVTASGAPAELVKLANSIVSLMK